MDNCRTWMEDFPPRNLDWISASWDNSEVQYQHLNLGLIAHSKVRYLSLLLLSNINVMLEKKAENRQFPSPSQQGIHGVRDGFLPTVGDAMELYDEACHSTPRSTIIKCFMKSQCLSESHYERGTALMSDLGMQSSANSTSLQPTVSQSEAGPIARDVNVIQSLKLPLPLSEILQEAGLNNNAETIVEMVNYTAPFRK